MTTELKNVLPKKLLPFQKKISEMLTSSVKITLQDSEQLVPWGSQTGGIPYWLDGDALPLDANGTPLNFLAQINFEELPRAFHDMGYPRYGLLQFFIGSDDLIGLDFEAPTEQKNFRVVFHEQVLQHPEQLTSTKDWSFLNTIPNTPFEDRSPKKMGFELKYELPHPQDFRFEGLFEKILNKFSAKERDGIIDELWEKLEQEGHKMQGFANFTQEDPRYDTEGYETLLFQLVSDDGLMWGDAGIANFFISEKNWKASRFDDVWYNWDCA